MTAPAPATKPVQQEYPETYEQFKFRVGMMAFAEAYENYEQCLNAIIESKPPRRIIEFAKCMIHEIRAGAP